MKETELFKLNFNGYISLLASNKRVNLFHSPMWSNPLVDKAFSEQVGAVAHSLKYQITCMM